MPRISLRFLLVLTVLSVCVISSAMQPTLWLASLWATVWLLSIIATLILGVTRPAMKNRAAVLAYAIGAGVYSCAIFPADTSTYNSRETLPTSMLLQSAAQWLYPLAFDPSMHYEREQSVQYEMSIHFESIGQCGLSILIGLVCSVIFALPERKQDEAEKERPE